jgi:hypothetical protein
MRVFAAALSALFVLPACASRPPPRWAEGGAPLVLPHASWTTGDGVTVEIREDGKVLADGAVHFILDRAGRIYDSSREAAAIVLPDGRIAGTDDLYFGRVGLMNASPPVRDTAWVSVAPDGAVMHYEADGERATDGRWHGCHGAALRTCTLVTHLWSLERVAAARGPVFIGVGFGVGVWR